MAMIVPKGKNVFDNASFSLSSPRDGRHGGAERPARLTPDSGETPYVRSLFRIIRVTGRETVLYAGCARSPILIPLAKKAKKVIVTDASEDVLHELKERGREEAMSNVSLWQGRGDDGKAPDVVIWSLPAPSGSGDEGIAELSRRARKGVYLLIGVGEGPFDRRIMEASGREFIMGPSFINCYNYLYYRMGIYGNITFLKEEMENEWAGLDEALHGQKWMFGDWTRMEEERVRAYLRKSLVPVGGRVRLPYERSCRWAVIWWEKDCPAQRTKNIRLSGRRR